MLMLCLLHISRDSCLILWDIAGFKKNFFLYLHTNINWHCNRYLCLFLLFHSTLHYSFTHCLKPMGFLFSFKRRYTKNKKTRLISSLLLLFLMYTILIKLFLLSLILFDSLHRSCVPQLSFLLLCTSLCPLYPQHEESQATELISV